jgi:hypothetical protein
VLPKGQKEEAISKREDDHAITAAAGPGFEGWVFKLYSVLKRLGTNWRIAISKTLQGVNLNLQIGDRCLVPACLLRATGPLPPAAPPADAPRVLPDAARSREPSRFDFFHAIAGAVEQAVTWERLAYVLGPRKWAAGQH